MKGGGAALLKLGKVDTEVSDAEKGAPAEARKRLDGLVQQQSTVATGRELTDQEAGTDLAKLLQQHKDEIVSQMETKLGTMMASIEEKLDMQAKGMGSEPTHGVAEQPSMNQAAGRRRRTEQKQKIPRAEKNCVMS